jgi:uncharacterized protein (TIGR00255 family)
MLKSMTGYGSSRIEGKDWNIAWEVRSVNNRHLDIRWRLPLFLRSMESSFEKIARNHGHRGRLEINLHFKVFKTELLGLSFNHALAKAMLEQISALADETGTPFTPDLSRFLNMSQLWEDDEFVHDPGMIRDLNDGLETAMIDWNAARTQEGEALYDDIKSRFTTLRRLHEEIVSRAPAVKQEKCEIMEKRIRTMLESFSLDLDESRFVQEASVLADKLDISEELTRLSAHFEQVDAVLEMEGDIGKRLDFLLQECFREINTCGNKAQDSQISHMVVNAKAELEKCREQVQNIE